MSYRTITIEFHHSFSPAFKFALEEAQTQLSFKQIDSGKASVYTVSYKRREFKALHKLIECFKNVRNKRVYVDNQEMPWPEVFHYNWCYRLRQQAYDPIEYCTGDSRQYPAFNPWGCLQTMMPLSNDTEWLHYGQFDVDGTFIFDKKKIGHYLKANTHRFRFCPALNIDLMFQVLDVFPETVNPNIDSDWEYIEVYGRHLTIGISTSPGSKKHYCGVSPSSPEAIKNIYQKILIKLGNKRVHTKS